MIGFGWNQRPSRFALTALQVALVLAAPTSVCRADDFFEERVRPLFVEKCQACHGSQTKMGGLDLSSAEGFAAGASGQPLVNSQNSADSLLLQVVNYDGRIKMPPTGKLSTEELSTLRQWVEAGGSWPGAPSAGISVRRTSGITAADREHWSFRPVLRSGAARSPGPALGPQSGRPLRPGAA